MIRASASESMWNESAVNAIDFDIWPTMSSTRKKNDVITSIEDNRVVSEQKQQPRKFFSLPENINAKIDID